MAVRRLAAMSPVVVTSQAMPAQAMPPQATLAQAAQQARYPAEARSRMRQAEPLRQAAQQARAAQLRAE